MCLYDMRYLALENQRKLGACPGPGAFHKFLAATGAFDLRHPGMQKGGITEKIIVLPSLILGVTGCPFRSAGGAGEGAAVNKVDGDVHAFTLFGE